MASDSKQFWIPLESNPEVLNKFSWNVGVPSSYKFLDVYDLDKELLDTIKKPLAVMLLYPLTQKAIDNPIGKVEEKSELYFIRQTIGNACGTIALVHALANNADKINFKDDGYMKKFIAETKSMTPEEKASYLEFNREMGVVHEDCAQEGQTQAPPRDQAVVRHFITLISRNNKLYELDGRKEGPVCHGEINKESFLESAAAMVKKFMARDPEEMDFSVMALAED
ncbi:ubiquitin carboxyl-terminal hydrolase-like [Octopus vulgaris]|uniref:Ubiquitin carboxyl-terminal hydrolase-like n=3 Tax=Octopus TaxID=6643 RepID=A0AA36B0M2_OCTVU|nr:ubiquitin carboxyl-terminal hydrolase [Octopus sinensis]CAI9725439.1 ubiquitin carboxyl-terminal hydrolase-like [Octopus vulgaris]